MFMEHVEIQIQSRFALETAAVKLQMVSFEENKKDIDLDSSFVQVKWNNDETQIFPRYPIDLKNYLLSSVTAI